MALGMRDIVLACSFVILRPDYTMSAGTEMAPGYLQC